MSYLWTECCGVFSAVIDLSREILSCPHQQQLIGCSIPLAHSTQHSSLEKNLSCLLIDWSSPSRTVQRHYNSVNRLYLCRFGSEIGKSTTANNLGTWSLETPRTARLPRRTISYAAQIHRQNMKYPFCWTVRNPQSAIQSRGNKCKRHLCPSKIPEGWGGENNNCGQLMNSESWRVQLWTHPWILQMHLRPMMMLRKHALSVERDLPSLLIWKSSKFKRKHDKGENSLPIH